MESNDVDPLDFATPEDLANALEEVLGWTCEVAEGLISCDTNLKLE